MYKTIKFSKKKKSSGLVLAFNRFPMTAKKNPTKNKAYDTGFRKWSDGVHTTYAIVVRRFRVMLYVPLKNPIACSPGN